MNTRQRVKTRRRLILKFSSDCSIDQEVLYFSNDDNKVFTATVARLNLF